jgi:hypothetical protein
LELYFNSYYSFILVRLGHYNKKDRLKENYNYETWKVGKEEESGFRVEKSFTRIYKIKSSLPNIVEMKNV